MVIITREEEDANVLELDAILKVTERQKMIVRSVLACQCHSQLIEKKEKISLAHSSSQKGKIRTKKKLIGILQSGE